ncbi:hypothetical protein JOB18_002038 [Solea senegalensis]|uniref:Uncharacterized protein n=1 Tax=Solea senegalensis TaxID=28829 RepID=A0AAV6QYP1_SOLSE|nr:hypothetical protein JOB18_002038 [Solea senegalensis]
MDWFGSRGWVTVRVLTSRGRQRRVCSSDELPVIKLKEEVQATSAVKQTLVCHGVRSGSNSRYEPGRLQPPFVYVLLSLGHRPAVR